jgi:hypothetical protein
VYTRLYDYQPLSSFYTCIKPRIHDATGWPTGWPTGWQSVYTIQSVVQPVAQPVGQPVGQQVASRIRLIKISMMLDAGQTRLHHMFNFVRKFKVRLPNQQLYENGSFCQRIKNFLLFYNFALIQRCLFLKRFRFLHLISYV